MLVIQEREYKDIDYFKNLDVISPTQMLLRFRKNVFLWGSLVIFISFAGLVIEGVSGGFIRADIVNPHVINIYISIIFIYSYIQYFLQLNNEYSSHSGKSSSIQAFSRELTFYLFKRELSTIIPGFNENSYSFISYAKNPRQEEKSNKVSCEELSPEVIEHRADDINKRDGFSLQGDKVFFEYRLSADDETYFHKNYDQLRNANLNEFLHYEFPVFFGGFASILIVYDLIASIFSLPPISILFTVSN